jgi:hypothetical protein
MVQAKKRGNAILPVLPFPLRNLPITATLSVRYMAALRKSHTFSPKKLKSALSIPAA